MSLSVTLSRRGMRLADTVFLTMPVALLQVWLGMRCSRPGVHCHIILGHHNFNILMLVSIIASIIGARPLPTAPVSAPSVHPPAAKQCCVEAAVHHMPCASLKRSHSMQPVKSAGGKVRRVIPCTRRGPRRGPACKSHRHRPPQRPPVEQRQYDGAGATLAYVSLDLNDCRFGLSRSQRRELNGKLGPWWTWIWRVNHLWEVVTFFVYRCLEIAARIVLLALFAVRQPTRALPPATRAHDISDRSSRLLKASVAAAFCYQATEGRPLDSPQSGRT
jgi:hypothetical protein